MRRGDGACFGIGLLAAMAIAGCGGGGGGEGTLTGRVFDATTLAVTASATVVATENGVEVARTTTDADGKFEIEVPADRDVVVKVTDGAHADGLEIARLPRGGKGHVEAYVVPLGMQATRSPTVTDTVKTPGGASVKLPANGIARQDGTPPTGLMQVSVTAIDPRSRAQLVAIPGKARGREPTAAPGTGQLIEMRAVLEVKMTENGAPLQLAPGQTAQIKIPISDPLAPSTLDLFHLEESTGEWVKVGQARKQRDAMGNEVYAADVTSLSTFAIGRYVAAASCVTGCVGGNDPAGTTVTVETVANDFLEAVQAGADGCFRVDVPLGAQLRLRAASEQGVATANVFVASDPTACVDMGTLVLDAAGVGQAVCPLAFIQCGAECADLSAHPSHCGTCGLGCGPEEQCIARTCACPATHMDCAGTCVPVRGDPLNCGTCGRVCNAGDECVDGTCVAIPCVAPAALCGTYCIDTRSDDDHCGSCNAPCAGGQVCVSGACTGGTIDPSCAVDFDCGGTALCLAGRCRPFPTARTASVFGATHEDFGDSFGPLPVTTVTVVGSNPTISAVSDTGGSFVLDAPLGVHLLLATGTDPNYWYGATEIVVTSGGTSVDLRLMAPTTTAATATALSAIPFSPGNGIVDVAYSSFLGAFGGQTAGITALRDAAFVWGPGVPQVPTPSSTLISGGGRDIYFSNVTPGIAGVLLTNPGELCYLATTVGVPYALNAPAYPVLAQTITRVFAHCAPQDVIDGTVCADPDDLGPLPCAPIPGASVEVLNTNPPITTTTDAVGTFVVPAPVGRAILYVAAPTHWGSVQEIDVGIGGTSVLIQIQTDAQVAAMFGGLSRGFDIAHGVVAMTFSSTSDVGGESAWIHAPSDPSFTQNAAGAHVPSGVTLPGVVAASRTPTIWFPNVRPGLVVPDASPLTCTVPPDAVVHVVPKAFSYVHATCGGG